MIEPYSSLDLTRAIYAGPSAVQFYCDNESIICCSRAMCYLGHIEFKKRVYQVEHTPKSRDSMLIKR